MSVHIHWSSNSKLYKFHHHFKYDQCVIFWLKKYVIGQIGLGSYGCHWAGQRRELIYYDCFLFSINTHLFGKRTGICGFVCLDLSGVVGDNHLWEEISTIGSRCSHGRPTPSSTPDRTHLSDFLFIICKEKDDEDESAYLNSAAEEN